MKLVKDLVALYREFRDAVIDSNPRYTDNDFSFDNFMYFVLNKYSNMSEITGYYIDLPQGAQQLDAVNGEGWNVPFSEYPDATYTAETSTHYGTLEWDNTNEITEVIVDGHSMEVQTLIGGYHAPQRPR